jgi:hypothetical protein
MEKRIVRSRKAVSNIIGAVFLVVTLVLAFNAVIWYARQQNDLNAQARNLQLLQQQSQLERFQVTKILISGSKPNATIQNTGSVAIHIVHMIITSQSAVPVTHIQYDVNYYIDPGSSRLNVGQNSQATGLNSQNTYSITFITERGNGVSAYYTPTPPATGTYATFGNLGYLSVSFTQSGFWYTSPNQATPAPAWAVSSSTACSNEIWWVVFTNHGVYDAKILRWSVAQMWQFRSAGGGGIAMDFFVVASSSTPGNLVAYTDQSISVPASTNGDYQTGGLATTLAFGAATAGGTAQQSLGCNQGQIFDFFIVVSYLYNNQQFNQLTAYASMVVTT